MSLLETLVGIELQRRDAWLARDKAALAALLDGDFVEINDFGRLSKAQLLDDLFDRLHLVEFSLESPLLHGAPEAPILSYACFEHLVVDGHEVQGRFHVASHFRDQGAGWRILCWQITPAGLPAGGHTQC